MTRGSNKMIAKKSNPIKIRRRQDGGSLPVERTPQGGVLDIIGAPSPKPTPDAQEQPAKLSPRDKDKVRENRFELTNTKADVIFAFYGYNESFAGDKGLAQFKQNADEFVQHTLSQKYNGKSAPKLVLFSPIAHEDLARPHWPESRFFMASHTRAKYARQAQ